MIYFNNEWHDDSQSTKILSFLTTGQAIFETMSYENGRLWFWERHLNRLQKTLDFFNCDYSALKLYKIISERLQQKTDLTYARVKLVILLPFLDKQPKLTAEHIIIQIEKLPLEPSEASAPLKLLAIPSPFSEGNQLIHHKTINYGFHFFYQKQAEQQGFDEVIYVNPENKLLETGRANIFAVKGNEIFTPPLSAGILPGTVRSVLTDFMDVKEREILLSELGQYDFCFLSGSVRELRPVQQINGHTFKMNPHLFSEIIEKWEAIKSRYLANQVK